MFLYSQGLTLIPSKHFMFEDGQFSLSKLASSTLRYLAFVHIARWKPDSLPNVGTTLRYLAFLQIVHWT